MDRKRITGLSAVATLLALTVAMPLTAQSSTASPQLGGDPMRPGGGHFHVGELGEKALVLERALRCNCSCGLDVHSCQFQMQCDVSPAWSQRIRDQLEAGAEVEAIQAGFVADYGTTVLMSPPAEGFNLVGYLLPSVAIVVAGMLIGLIARGNRQGGTPAPARRVGPEEERRLKEALRQLDQSEGPDW